jgi:hypothetical protein
MIDRSQTDFPSRPNPHFEEAEFSTTIEELRQHMKRSLELLDRLEILGPDCHQALALDRLEQQFPSSKDKASVSSDGWERID